MQISRAILLLIMSLASFGCTSYKVDPPIVTQQVSGRLDIYSFKFESQAPWKSSRFAKEAYEVTRRLISKASGEGAAVIYPVLQVKITEFSSGGACTQEYLTGLSFGLIPSWCTRPELYRFQFDLLDHNRLCARKVYSVNSITFAHILALPFALMDNEFGPLDIYKAALEEFVNAESCEAS